MKGKSIGIFVVTLLLCCTLSTASDINDDEISKNIIILEPNPNNPKAPVSIGDGWAIAEGGAFGPNTGDPWPYVFTSKSHTKCIAQFSATTGEGLVDSWSYSYASWALIQVGLQKDNEYLLWSGDSTDGRVYINEGSVDIDTYPAANGHVTITVRKYNPQGGFVKKWEKEIIRCQGNEVFDLEGHFLDFDLTNQFLYKVFFYFVAEQFGDSSAKIDPVKFKEVWILYKEDYEVNLIEPEKGGIYIGARKLFVHPTLPFALLFGCNGIKCIAETSGPVDHVTFSFYGKKATDEEPDGDVWKGTIYGVKFAHNVLYAYAYDSNNEIVADDSVQVFKISGS